MIVVPMAGISRRFTDAGYKMPKYMLDLEGRSVFSHALSSFEKYFETEDFLIVARDVAGTEAFLRSELQSLNVKSSKVVMLRDATEGQADTVGIGLVSADVAAAAPITIFNIDTFRPGFSYPDADWFDRADGYLEVMIADDPGFSFVLPGDDGQGRVLETAEKRVISNLASTGLYHFRRSGDFLSALAEARTRRTEPELYVAPLYNQLIGRDCDIRYVEIAASEVIFCGTPAQYETLLNAEPAVRE